MDHGRLIVNYEHCSLGNGREYKVLDKNLKTTTISKE